MKSAIQKGSTGVLAVHHVAIETTDVDNTVAWYEAFLGCERTWTLTSFSLLTQERLPGISTLTELAVGAFKLHVYERAPQLASVPLVGAGAVPAIQFQHLAFAVGSAAALSGARARWIELFDSGKFSFARSDCPTPIVTDADGIASFYCYDVNGLELELTFAREYAPA